MRFDFLDSARAHPESLAWLDLQQTLKDISGSALQDARDDSLFHSDVLVHLHLVLVVVRWETDEHLEE